MLKISLNNNHIIYVLFLCVFLSACGDGIGSQVITTSVTNGDTAISTDESFDITFLHPVDTETVTNESLFLVEGSEAEGNLNNALNLLLPLSGICDYSLAISSTLTCSSNISCSLTPNIPLRINTAYTLCLTTSISYANPTAFGSFPGTSVSFTTASLESIELTPTAPTLTEINETQEFTATGTFDDASTETLTTGLTWTSSDTDVATISSDGVATALADGTTTITVTDDESGVSATSVLTVDLMSETVTNYTIGGSISGLSGTIVIQNNAGDDKTITSDGSFTFSTPISNGATYSVSIASQPATQTCTISGDVGTVSSSNVTTISISCTTNTYTVGGTVSGLSGTVVLQNNGGNNKSIASNGGFTFTTAVNDGGSYVVTVLTQPAGQTCTLSNASGTMSGANVTNVSVSCVNNSKKLFVTATTSNGNLGGVSGADAICMADANYPSSGTYKALISNGSIINGAMRIACTDANCGSSGVAEHVDWILSPNTPYVRAADDTPVFTSDANGIFVFGTLTNAFSGSAANVWTGLNGDWTTATQTCSGYTSSMSAGAYGTATSTTSSAITGGASCATPNLKLVCIEQ